MGKNPILQPRRSRHGAGATGKTLRTMPSGRVYLADGSHGSPGLVIRTRKKKKYGKRVGVMWWGGENFPLSWHHPDDLREGGVGG